MPSRNEVIEAITEIEDRPAEEWGTEQGYEVRTNKQTISLMIGNDAGCCESWGYLTSEDNPTKFVGAILLEIRATDTNRTAKSVSDLRLNDGDIMFIDLVTDRGILQLAAYNAHNGYYGHKVRFKSEQLEQDRVI